MKILTTLCFCLFLTTACSKKERNITRKVETLNTITTQLQQNTQPNNFTTFLGLDSVIVFENSINDTTIDSITMHDLSFQAKYLGCFRGNVNISLYSNLRNRSPKNYETIMAITTGHRILVNEVYYHFNGNKNVECNYPESSNVDIRSTVYSLYSSSHLMGRIMIIDSINTNRNNRR